MPSCDPFARAFSLRARNCSGVPPASLAAGVIQEVKSDGAEVEALSDVRTARAVCSQNDRPAGVTLCLQFSTNKVEPCNFVIRSAAIASDLSDDECGGRLLAEDDRGSSRSDESHPLWPEVVAALVALLSSGWRVVRARTRAGPDFEVVGPSGESERVAPYCNARERVELDDAFEVLGPEVGDASSVDASGRDVSGADEVLDPLRRVVIDLAVERGTHVLAHRSASAAART